MEKPEDLKRLRIDAIQRTYILLYIGNLATPAAIGTGTHPVM
jgi:hypothetical protein